MICEREVPTLDDIFFALKAAEGRYVEFRYVPVHPPRPATPSVVAARADTRMVGEIDVAKGWLAPDPAGRSPVWVTKESKVAVRILSINRRKALETGEGYYSKPIPSSPEGKEKGEYLWRTFRADGIQLETVKVTDGPNGKIRLFPNAR